MELARGHTNTRETVARLHKDEAPRFGTMPLFSLALMLISFGIFCIRWTLLFHTLLLYGEMLSLFLCYTHPLEPLIDAQLTHTLSCRDTCTKLRNQFELLSIG